MAVNVREFADTLDAWLGTLRDKESPGEILETDIIHAAEVLRSVARLITGLGGRIETLEKGPQGGG